MQKLLLRLIFLLTAFAAPAKSTTYIQYGFTALMNYFEYSEDRLVRHSSYYLYGKFTIEDGNVDESLGASISGKSLDLSRCCSIPPEAGPWNFVKISFDHELTGLPTNADGFLSGSWNPPFTSCYDCDSYGFSIGVITKFYASSYEAPAGRGWSYTDSTVPAPEPSTWILMILGFGLCGAALRRHGAAHDLTKQRLRLLAGISTI